MFNVTNHKATWWSAILYHQEQLDAVLNSTDIKDYAYILHDKCPQDENPELLKKPHWHVLVKFRGQQRGSWFKRFETKEIGTVFRQPVGDAQGAYDYLIHDTAPARKKGKRLYDPAERISTIENFDNDLNEKEDENLRHYLDLLELVEGNMTWHQFLYKMPKRLHMVGNFHKSFILLYKERHPYHRSDMDSDILKHAMDNAKAQWEDPKIKTENGMRVLSPEECADLPF
jgi:hypothetical protein